MSVRVMRDAAKMIDGHATLTTTPVRVRAVLADVLEEAAETWEVLTPGLGDPSKDPLLAELAKLAQLIVNGEGT